MKFLQALQSAVLFCGIATATPVSQPDDVEAEAFEVGYFFRDPNYTGEYIAMAPAVLGTCYDLPDWFISSNGVTSLSMNSPGAYVCTFYGAHGCNTNEQVSLNNVRNSISDLRNVHFDNLVYSYICHL